MPDNNTNPSLKLRTARTLKWNTIDRISGQLALAVIGVILANILSKEDYGLTGVLAIFQSFAIVFVDSGFGAALLQKKNVSDVDYSTVFWFNMAVAAGIYIVLWFAAPWIADYFHSQELINLSRVMFITFIFTALGIIQTNRLMKQMDVRQIAISNVAATALSGAIGIVLAVRGFGAWALVWQSLSMAAVKSGWLWLAVKWRPLFIFSRSSLRSVLSVGTGVFTSSFLNTLFLNLYSFIIGRWSLASLGVYTQADKWSKMGSASLSQIITATFVPLLARFQDSVEQFIRYMRRIDRFAAILVIPLMGGLAMAAEPLFHTLFGNLWDAAIPLFQILCVRGIFIILISVYNNFLLAGGHAKSLVVVEIVKDALMLAALAATFFTGSLTALVWGLLAASVLTWLFMLWLTSRKTRCPIHKMLVDLLPGLALSAVALSAGWASSLFIHIPIISLSVRLVVAAAAYILIARACRMQEYYEAKAYLLGRFLKK